MPYFAFDASTANSNNTMLDIKRLDKWRRVATEGTPEQQKIWREAITKKTRDYTKNATDDQIKQLTDKGPRK